MLLTERRPASTAKSSPFVTTDSPSSSFSGSNRQTYLRLRLALGIRLRRQVFLAVCDDVAFKGQLTQWLVNDLSRDPLPEMDAIANEPAFDQTQLGSRSHGIQMVTLTLHPSQPDLQKQISEWLAHRRGRVDRSQIAFQIVGIDSITRQSATVQRQFLTSLRVLGRHYAQWDLNLVLWVTKPWFHSIRQSAPEFWRWHTGIFDFTEVPHSEMQRNNDRNEYDKSTADDRVASESAAPIAETVRLSDLNASFTAQWLGASSLTVTNVLTETVRNLALLHQQSADDKTLAEAYRDLGNQYRDHTNPTEESLSLGIRAYQAALDRLPQQSNSPMEVDLLNDLGNLHWMRSRQQPDATEQCKDLETAVDRYQKAIVHTDAQHEPQRYIMLQNNLGATWGELAQNFDAETYLPHSISAYESSLNVQSADQDSQRRANTENNLGTAYWTLAQYQKPEAPSLQQAIAHYGNALKFYDAEHYSMPHAMIQNNLGTAFWNLSQCELLARYSSENSQDLLIQAIMAYKVALLYRTPEALPLGHAATQNNLGTAYWNLATDRLTHADEIGEIIQLTIVSYQASLTMVEALIESGSVNFSFDPFATHYNLATAFNSSVKHVASAEHHNLIQKAFTHHLIAWQGWQEQPDQATAAIDGLVQVLRTAHDRLGRDAQSKLLATLPPQLLTVVMPKV